MNMIQKMKIRIAIVGVIFLLGILGFDIIESVPYLPLKEWSQDLIAWLNKNLDSVFSSISFLVNLLFTPIKTFLLTTPPFIIFGLVLFLGWLLGGWRLTLFIAFALAFIGGMEYWEASMKTLSLVITAAILALIIGIPFGILKAHSKTASVLLDPVLDFMQTMPLFVYLIPAVLFFSIGNVSGIISTIIFATPPAVRLTALGIEQIPKEMLEAGKAFGASANQLLMKVEIPLAMPSIMAGVNQTIMLALSMVVVAALVGAEGLGGEVVRGIQRLQVGQGIASGVAVVLLAMILDRLTKGAWKKK